MRLRLYFNALKHTFYKWVLRKRFLTATALKYDLRFRFYIRDGAGRDIYYKYGVYIEDYITTYLLDNIGINDQDLIIDIGANIGWYSLVLSWKARPVVYAFEPDPLNYSLLSQNVALNGRKNIQPVNAALDERESTKALYLYKDYNLGRHSFIKTAKSKQQVDVKTIVLDTFLREQGLQERPVKFIKIDIEGFEFNALRGARETLRRTQHVLTEFTPQMMQDIDEDPGQFLKFMKELGFDANVFEQTKLVPADLQDILARKEQINIFWSRK